MTGRAPRGEAVPVAPVAAKLTGLPSVWAPHDLRHAAADALYKVTNDVVLAQQLLRHSDIRTTRDYLRPDIERLAAGMRQVEASRAPKTPDYQGDAR